VILSLSPHPPSLPSLSQSFLSLPLSPTVPSFYILSLSLLSPSSCLSVFSLFLCATHTIQLFLHSSRVDSVSLSLSPLSSLLSRLLLSVYLCLSFTCLSPFFSLSEPYLSSLFSLTIFFLFSPLPPSLLHLLPHFIPLSPFSLFPLPLHFDIHAHGIKIFLAPFMLYLSFINMYTPPVTKTQEPILQTFLTPREELVLGLSVFSLCNTPTVYIKLCCSQT
jgi:hypothetical protein